MCRCVGMEAGDLENQTNANENLINIMRHIFFFQ